MSNFDDLNAFSLPSSSSSSSSSSSASSSFVDDSAWYRAADDSAIADRVLADATRYIDNLFGRLVNVGRLEEGDEEEVSGNGAEAAVWAGVGGQATEAVETE